MKCIICGFKPESLEKVVEHFIKDFSHSFMLGQMAIEGIKNNDLSGYVRFLIDEKNFDLIHHK